MRATRLSRIHNVDWLLCGDGASRERKVVTFGDFDESTCVPVSCFGGSIYQQLFSPSELPSTRFFVDWITFYVSTPGQFDTRPFSLYLSTNTNGFLTVNPLGNRGSDRTEFVSVAGGGFDGGSDVTFRTLDPFLFDPSEGDLLMEIDYSGSSTPLTDALYLEKSDDEAQIESGFDDGLFFRLQPGGLRTTFLLTPAVTTTPEPATLGFVAIGLAGLTAQRRQRRRRHLRLSRGRYQRIGASRPCALSLRARGTIA
ncbi:MAG: PEP-CTERM sorting domain-containing protein [Gemmatimonadaceae bacterium]